MYQHGLGMSDTERPAYNPRTDIIPSVLPTSAAVPVNLMGNTSSQIAPSMGNQSLHGIAPLFNLSSTNSSGTLSLQVLNDELMTSGLHLYLEYGFILIPLNLKWLVE